MKRTSAISRVMALTLLATGIACGPGKNDGPAIEKIGGVTYVRNARQGPWDSGGTSRLRLVRDLQIGQLSGKDEFLFVYISDVAVDGRGDVYVGDRQLNEVRKFDREGRYLLTVGRKGQGPGEFQSIRTVSVNPRDELIVYDMAGRISVFSSRGEHKETTKKLSAGSWMDPSEIFPGPDGYLLFGKAGGSPNLFHVFDAQWKETDSFIPYELSGDREYEEQSLGFYPGNACILENGDIVYTKYHHDNEIRVYAARKLAQVWTRDSDIKKAYEVQVFRDVEKAMAVPRDADYDFKSFGQGIAFVGKSFQNSLGVFEMPDGRVVNFLSVRVSKARRDLWAELYDPTGELLSFSKLGDGVSYDIRCMDSGGRFYAIERREFNKVIAFRLEY